MKTSKSATARREEVSRSDEQMVREHLETKGLIVVPIDKGKDPTPDFKVFRPDGSIAFFCEVKSIAEDIWLDNLLDTAPPGTMVGGGRPDPTFNSISTKIHEASKQFGAVNPGGEHPNVLAFVNHEDSYDAEDVVNTITGDFFASDGTRHPIYRKFSEGRIVHEKQKIALHLWFEEGNDPRFLFNTSLRNQMAELCALFSFNPEEIPAYGTTARKVGH